jgi:hypothetical protein
MGSRDAHQKQPVPLMHADDLRDELVAAAERKKVKRELFLRRRRLVLNRISGMGLFGAWIVTFQHYNPGVPVNWIIVTVIVGGVGMVIYSYGD